MKTEQQARNSADNSEHKVLALIEFFFATEDVEKIYDAIYDNQVEVNDFTDMIDDVKFTEKEA